MVLGVSGIGGIPGTPLCPGDSGEGRDGGIPGSPLCPGDSGEGRDSSGGTGMGESQEVLCVLGTQERRRTVGTAVVGLGRPGSPLCPGAGEGLWGHQWWDWDWVESNGTPL